MIAPKTKWRDGKPIRNSGLPAIQGLDQMKTTAEYRTAARAAEKALDWAAAAIAWQAAIDAYPAKGALADADKAGMASKRDAARGMVA